MGGIGSKKGPHADKPRPTSADKLISKKVKAQKMKEDARKKVLLLGPGESGKSTFFRQMILNYKKGGFTETEKVGFRNDIRMGIPVFLNELCLGAEVEPEFKSTSVPSLSEGKTEISVDGTSMTDYVKQLEATWKKPEIQKAWTERVKYVHVPECLEYFMSRVSAVYEPKYLPSADDILRIRVRTTGIVQQVFETKEGTLVMIDVGGQRNERRKWISLFEGVMSAVIFIVAVGDYDKKVFEDDKTNSMQEALKVFNEVVNNEFFQDTTFIVFLNKSDLFLEKMKKTSLKVAFDDWDVKNDGNMDAAYEFIVKKFYEKKKRNTKDLIFHRTTATDTENFKNVWKSITFIILDSSLVDMGLLE